MVAPGIIGATTHGGGTSAFAAIEDLWCARTCAISASLGAASVPGSAADALSDPWHGLLCRLILIGPARLGTARPAICGHPFPGLQLAALGSSGPVFVNGTNRSDPQGMPIGRGQPQA